ncbi:uncharacterized protein UV8b_01066 [Ustilaginoidea virens]|uniref:Tat pathway signal sequence n=2 Tax=Ustilaginoidea virens TaxID=1159556 RepID=A0A8E5HJY2_USTVR|nr:uncharacterized protein UV8b_01066 [Ustilaginoidea virens]QUC16825.1 hypothetical protein UV8b_01066 [Ustilaginoidea virens]
MVPRKVLQRWSGYSLLEGRTTQTANDDAETCCSADRATRPSRRENALVCLLVANTMLFLMTAAMLASLRRPRSTELLNQALRATSSYSPVFDMIDLEPSIRRINGTVNPAGKLSIARQFPNPEADAVWENDIELIRPIPVTREQIVKMGKNPDTVAKLENSVWGLGDDAYVAALDLFHNLHCLNALRQAIYPDYYNQSRVDTENQQSMTAIHLNHCVDILFQHISCRQVPPLSHWTES